MKSILKKAVVFFILLYLTGCVATENPVVESELLSEMNSESISSYVTSNEASSKAEERIDPSETKQIMQSLVADYEETLFIYPNLCKSIVYSMDENGVIHDNLTEYWKVGTTYYFKVLKNGTCNSIQDITTIFEKVYTKDFLQENFYHYALEGYQNKTDKTFLSIFREHNGSLYVQDVAAISGLVFPVIETIVRERISDTKIVFNDDMQVCDSPFPIRMTIIKTENGWRISECINTWIVE